MLGRQFVGKPAKRCEIITKANRAALANWRRRRLVPALYATPPDPGRSGISIDCQGPQPVECAGIRQLFGTLVKLYIERGYAADHVLNIHQTAFRQARNNVDCRWSWRKQVWPTDTGTSFPLSVVACRSAAGAKVLPRFALPGNIVPLEILSGCGVEGAAATTTEARFRNSDLFRSGLGFFKAAVPSKVARPLLLIMSGCSLY